jgi:hypothetical protein
MGTVVHGRPGNASTRMDELLRLHHREPMEGEHIRRPVQRLAKLRPRAPAMVGPPTWSGIGDLLRGCLAARR